MVAGPTFLSSTMTAPVSTKPRNRRRQPPVPNSVLDPAALRNALDEANVSVRPVHIDAFYHAFHRQGFPSLPEFVKNYENAHQQQQGNDAADSTAKMSLKNPMSLKRKHITKVQLPRAFLQFLQTTTALQTLTSKVAVRHTSKDKSTTKLVIELHDGHVVESVLMRYVNDQSGGRASLCVSSQVGCAMGCTFCATGTMGLFGNLSTGEILEQIVHADKILAEDHAAEGQENSDTQNQNNNINKSSLFTRHEFVRNVVFMGMGEPLDNLNNVVAACRALIHPQRWNLAHHCVTVSTVGLVSQIRRLTAELPQVNLALSLHAPNQAARQAIVPTASRYPIEQLVEALDNHLTAYQTQRRQGSGNKSSSNNNNNNHHHHRNSSSSIKRRAMIEYVMLEGPTSTLQCAHELGQLCQGRSLVVNLIPYNATNVKDVLKCPSEDHLQEFRNIVASYNVFCTIRRTMGADIDSACGQLVQSVKASEEKQEPTSVVDIEDVVATKMEKRAVAVNMLTSKRQSAETVCNGSHLHDNHTSHVDLESWIRPLTVATVLSAVCLVVSATRYFQPTKQR